MVLENNRIKNVVALARLKFLVDKNGRKKRVTRKNH
jgi:hypothetical protein